MLRTLLCDNHNHFLVVTDHQVISELIKRKDHHLWIDLEGPTREEFLMIEEEFSLHPLAIEDAMVRHQRPKVDQYSNFYFVVFYAVGLYEPEGGQQLTTERRGLRGSRFHRVDRAVPPPTPAQVQAMHYEPGSLIASASDNGSAGAQPHAISQIIAGGDSGNAQQVAGRNERVVLNEISLFMGENYLITVHQNPIFELDEVARRWYRNVVTIHGEAGTGGVPQGTRRLTEAEARSLKVDGDDNEGERSTMMKKPVTLTADDSGPKVGTLDKGARNGPDEVTEEYRGNGQQGSNDVGILLYSLLDTLVDGYFPVIDGIVDRIEDLEEEIFEHFNQSAIEDVFNLKKDLLAMRKVLTPERDVLNILTRRDLPIFEQHTLLYFQDVYDHVVRITDSIDTYRDLLSSALDSYLSMQSNRLNITVQTLTSVSIIMMTISTFTGWFGMNFDNMPELHQTWTYPALFVVVGTAVFLEILFFKRKRWL
jgi:magnesium/cobalt transport protein CorA